MTQNIPAAEDRAANSLGAPMLYTSLLQDLEFTVAADSCCYLANLPPETLKYPNPNFILRLSEMSKGKKSTPQNWLQLKGRNSSKFSYLINHLKSLSENELLYTIVKYHEKIFDIAYKNLAKIIQKVQDSKNFYIFTLTDLIKRFLASTELLKKLFFFIPKKFSEGWRQFEIVSVLSTILDHGNNPEFRIYGFRLLLLYMNSLMGKYTETIVDLFKNSIIIQSFVEEDLFKKDFSTDNIIASLNSTPNDLTFEFKQTPIKSISMPTRSIYPIQPINTNYYMSVQSVASTRMVQEFFYNVLFMSNFVLDEHNTSNLENHTRYFSGKSLNLVHTPSNDSLHLPFKASKRKEPDNAYDDISVYLMNAEDADISLNSSIGLFITNYVLYFIQSKEVTQGLGGVPIPLMKMISSFLFKYVAFNQKVLNDITDYNSTPHSGDNPKIMSHIDTPANDFVYSEKMRKYQQYIWLESNKSLSIFTESVIFGVLRIDKSTITDSGYDPITTENIYQDVTDTQMATLNIFRIFMEMDVSKRPVQLVKPLDNIHTPKWTSLMLKYLVPVLAVMHTSASIREPYTFSRFSVFYLSLLVFRSIFALPNSEIPLEIKDSCLSHLFEILEAMLTRPIAPQENPTDPYCLGTQAIMIIFECIVEAWLLTIHDKSKYWVKFEKLFFIESEWNNRYHIWANVLQSLTMTMGTKIYNIDELELLQDYMFSGQRTKGGSRGLINKLEATQRNYYVAIKHGNRIDNPFLPQTPFIITSKCSLIASQIVLDYLNKKRELRNDSYNYVLDTLKNHNSELDISEFLHSLSTDSTQEPETSNTRSKNAVSLPVPDTGDENRTSNPKKQYNLDSYISVTSKPKQRQALTETRALQMKQGGLVDDKFTSIKKTQSVPYRPGINLYTNSVGQSGLGIAAPPLPESNTHQGPYPTSTLNNNSEPNKLYKTNTVDNLYDSSHLGNNYGTASQLSNYRNISFRSEYPPNASISSNISESKESSRSLSLNMNLKDKFKNSFLHKRSVSVLNTFVTKLKLGKKKVEIMRFDVSETPDSFRRKEALNQLEHSVNIIDDHFNEWILIKTPFYKSFDLNSDLPWNQITCHTQIGDIWSKWWQLVERPLNIRNLEAKKIVTMGLSRAWDIKLVLTDRQTATGVSSKADEKLAFAHWLFELCKGPQDSDDCSIIAVRAISRVFCRSFSPNYSIPAMYQALFYRILLESLSDKALDFEYGQRLLEVTLTECNRIFALDVPGCFMIVKSLADSLRRIFSVDFPFQLNDKAMNGAVILLISCITVLFSSTPATFEKVKISPIVTYNQNNESVVEWMPLDTQKKIDRLCYLLLKLSGEHNNILKHVSKKVHTRITCNLIGSLSTVVLMNKSSKSGIAENAIHLILANLFETNKQYVFVATDSLRVFLSYNSTQKIVNLLGIKLVFKICQILAYCCYEQLDRFIDTGDSHYVRMFSNMLHLLMSYIILVPSVISGQGSTADVSKQKSFERFLFNELLQEKVNELFTKVRPISSHNYNYAINMAVVPSKNNSPTPTDIITKLEKTEFIETPEYTALKKLYSSRDLSVPLKWIKQCILVFSYQLMQRYNTYVPIQEFERYMDDSNSAGDDLENIADGDEMMFFGYGDSIISAIKPAGKTQLKLTVRSAVGKYTGYVQSTLEGESLKEAAKIEPTTLTNNEIAKFLKSNSDFSLKKFVANQQHLESDQITNKSYDDMVSDDETEFELPKVRFINSYDIDWVNYKASATNEFGSENERIERLVSNTKDFVFSYKNKEENALLNFSNQEPELLVETINNKTPIFRELRLFLHNFGLFDWTKSEPSPFKLLLPSNSLFKELSLLDKLTSKESIKVAICYVAPNQTTESEILSNDAESTSLAYREFVSSLGWPVKLENFGGYTGKLNTDGSDGKVAPFFVTNSLELVFHDSTEMPTDKTDPKQLKKKRHIGNDYVHIIWNENFCDYRPETITGDFGNAQIHIRPLLSNLGSYGVSLFVDQRVDSVGPLVDNMIIGPEILSNVVRSWVISAHRQTLWMRSPAFYSPPLVRMDNINQIITKHLAPEWTENAYPGSFLINPGVIAKLSIQEENSQDDVSISSRGDLAANSDLIREALGIDRKTRGYKLLDELQTSEVNSIASGSMSTSARKRNTFVLGSSGMQTELKNQKSLQTHNLSESPNRTPTLAKSPVSNTFSSVISEQSSLKSPRPKLSLGYFNKADDEDVFYSV